LAGTAGVQLYESLIRRAFLNIDALGLSLSPDGREFAGGLGIDLERLSASRTPMCRECLDWSERKTHLAGSLGRALLDHMIEDRWVRIRANSRVISFTARGQVQSTVAFPLASIG
jgi:hypothetical protein